MKRNPMNKEDIINIEIQIAKLVKQAIIEGLDNHPELNEENQEHILSKHISKKLSYMKDEGFIDGFYKITQNS